MLVDYPASASVWAKAKEMDLQRGYLYEASRCSGSVYLAATSGRKGRTLAASLQM